MFATGNASALKSGPTCYLKNSFRLPLGKCGNGSFWSNETMAGFCAAMLPPADDCHGRSNLARGSPGGSISFQRWIDLAYSIIWLLKTPGAVPAEHRPDILALLRLVQYQVWDSQIDFFGPQAPCPVLRGS